MTKFPLPAGGMDFFVRRLLGVEPRANWGLSAHNTVGLLVGEGVDAVNFAP